MHICRRSIRRLRMPVMLLMAAHGGALTGPLAGQSTVDAVAGGAAGLRSEVDGYRLRAGDAIRLMVHDEPELAGEYTVLENGTVLLPLIGLVEVSGAEFSDVARRVRAAYASELVAATIVVQPLIRVRVLGEVRVPGLYLVDATYGMRDVVARAGGLSPAAAPDRILLVREGGTQTYEPESMEPGLVLQPGDEIVVPRRGWVRENLPVLVGAGTSVIAAALTALLVR